MNGAALIPPKGLPEKSLVPILDEAHPEGFDETFFSHTFHEVTNYYPYRVLRGRKYKYVRNLYPELTTPLPSDLWASPTWQAVRNENLEMGKRRTEKFLHQDAEALFDIENDPMESTNIIHDPAGSGRRRSHATKSSHLPQRNPRPLVPGILPRGRTGHGAWRNVIAPSHNKRTPALVILDGGFIFDQTYSASDLGRTIIMNFSGQ